MTQKVDVLAFAAHPDDIEISCGGTLAKLISEGKKVAIVDLTQGELGTRGTAEIRAKEASKASAILGVSYRQNLQMPDGFFENNPDNLLKVVAAIRQYQPEILLANSIEDRHPDHGKAAKLVADAVFLSGLPKVETLFNGAEQLAWRPKVVYHYIQDRYIHPSFIVDVTPYIELKMKALKAFKSQFYDPNSTEPASPISGKEFFDFIESRARDFGRIAGVEFAEGFTVQRAPLVKDLFDLG
ncbi:MAG: bacillithiol biosynthesis deacetylase BshB1 [Luteibaculaceae bacterium]